MFLSSSSTNVRTEVDSRPKKRGTDIFWIKWYSTMVYSDISMFEQVALTLCMGNVSYALLFEVRAVNCQKTRQCFTVLLQRDCRVAWSSWHSTSMLSSFYTLVSVSVSACSLFSCTMHTWLSLVQPVSFADCVQVTLALLSMTSLWIISKCTLRKRK